MPKGRFWMGKCESGETSMNDLSDMMAGTPRRGVRIAQRAVRTLQQIQCAQIFPWLIEAATAKRYNKSPAIFSRLVSIRHSRHAKKSSVKENDSTFSSSSIVA